MYKVLFIGLVCFLKQNASQIALMPDGSNTTPAHIAKIAVDPATILGFTNWGTDADVKKGDFRLTVPVNIDLQGASAASPSKLDDSKQKLVMLPKGFKITPSTAKTIAQVTIKNGTLKTSRWPGTDADDPKASILTELTVPHSGTILVKVTPKSGGKVRTILLKAGTEIAIVNDRRKSNTNKPATKGHEHFNLYAMLGGGAQIAQEAPPIPSGIPRTTSSHRVFDDAVPIVDGVSCPNTGCCPKP
jgi:hypothetical protein